jgi:hypothetical protein
VATTASSKDYVRNRLVDDVSTSHTCAVVIAAPAPKTAGFCVAILLAAIPAWSGQDASAPLFVSAVVRPSCGVEVAPPVSGMADVLVRCGKATVSQVHLTRQAQSPTTDPVVAALAASTDREAASTTRAIAAPLAASMDGDVATTRIASLGAAIVQIDF